MIDIAEALVFAPTSWDSVYPFDNRIDQRIVDAADEAEVLRREGAGELARGHAVEPGCCGRRVDSNDRGLAPTVADQVVVDLRGIRQDGPKVTRIAAGEVDRRVGAPRLHVARGDVLGVEEYVKAVGVVDDLSHRDPVDALGSAALEDSVPGVRSINRCIETRNELGLNQARRQAGADGSGSAGGARVLLVEGRAQGRHELGAVGHQESLIGAAHRCNVVQKRFHRGHLRGVSIEGEPDDIELVELPQRDHRGHRVGNLLVGTAACADRRTQGLAVHRGPTHVAVRETVRDQDSATGAAAVVRIARICGVCLGVDVIVVLKKVLKVGDQGGGRRRAKGTQGVLAQPGVAENGCLNRGVRGGHRRCAVRAHAHQAAFGRDDGACPVVEHVDHAAGARERVGSVVPIRVHALGAERLCRERGSLEVDLRDERGPVAQRADRVERHQAELDALEVDIEHAVSAL